MTESRNFMTNKKRKKADPEEDSEDYSFKQFERNMKYSSGKEVNILGTYMIIKKLESIENLVRTSNSKEIIRIDNFENEPISNNTDMPTTFSNLIDKSQEKPSKGVAILKKFKKDQNNHEIRSRNGSRLEIKSYENEDSSIVKDLNEKIDDSKKPDNGNQEPPTSSKKKEEEKLDFKLNCISPMKKRRKSI